MLPGVPLPTPPTARLVGDASAGALMAAEGDEEGIGSDRERSCAQTRRVIQQNS